MLSKLVWLIQRFLVTIGLISSLGEARDLVEVASKDKNDDTSFNSLTPGILLVPGIPGIPGVPLPSIPGIPGLIPGIPGISPPGTPPLVSGISDIPDISGIPPLIPGIPEIPGLPSPPSKTLSPYTKSPRLSSKSPKVEVAIEKINDGISFDSLIPGIPDIPGIPSIPGIPGIPEIPSPPPKTLNPSSKSLDSHSKSS